MITSHVIYGYVYLHIYQFIREKNDKFTVVMEKETFQIYYRDDKFV